MDSAVCCLERVVVGAYAVAGVADSLELESMTSPPREDRAGRGRVEVNRQ